MCTMISHYVLKTRSHKHNELRRNTFSLLSSTKDLRGKKKHFGIFFVKYNIQEQLTSAKNVHKNIQEVGMYFLSLRKRRLTVENYPFTYQEFYDMFETETGGGC